MRTSRNTHLFALCACTAWAFDGRSVEASGLTLPQAREVLELVLRHDRLPIGASVEVLTTAQGGPLFDGFAAFGVSFDSPGAGAGTTLGLYAVNLRTGEVWETNRCRRSSFPTLKALQRELSSRTHAPLGENLSALRLGCRAR